MVRGRFRARFRVRVSIMAIVSCGTLSYGSP